MLWETGGGKALHHKEKKLVRIIEIKSLYKKNRFQDANSKWLSHWPVKFYKAEAALLQNVEVFGVYSCAPAGGTAARWIAKDCWGETARNWNKPLRKFAKAETSILIY